MPRINKLFNKRTPIFINKNEWNIIVFARKQSPQHNEENDPYFIKFKIYTKITTTTLQSRTKWWKVSLSISRKQHELITKLLANAKKLFAIIECILLLFTSSYSFTQVVQGFQSHNYAYNVQMKIIFAKYEKLVYESLV